MFWYKRKCSQQSWVSACLLWRKLKPATVLFWYHFWRRGVFSVAMRRSCWTKWLYIGDCRFLLFAQHGGFHLNWWPYWPVCQHVRFRPGRHGLKSNGWSLGFLVFERLSLIWRFVMLFQGRFYIIGYLLCFVWRFSMLERPVWHRSLLGWWWCCQEVFLVFQGHLPEYNRGLAVLMGAGISIYINE